MGEIEAQKVTGLTSREPDPSTELDSKTEKVQNNDPSPKYSQNLAIKEVRGGRWKGEGGTRKEGRGPKLGLNGILVLKNKNEGGYMTEDSNGELNNGESDSNRKLINISDSNGRKDNISDSNEKMYNLRDSNGRNNNLSDSHGRTRNLGDSHSKHESEVVDSNDSNGEIESEVVIDTKNDREAEAVD